MYQAKQQGRNGYLFYHHQMNEQHNSKLQLQNLLRMALKQQEFTLNYQLQVNSDNQQVVGIEALLRWYQPELGSVSPAAFIPLAEELGLMVDIEKWVLHQACMQRKIWLNKGLSLGRIAVNVSAMHFNGDLVESIKTTLVNTQLPAEYLEIEITESCFIENIDEAKATLDEIRQLGIKIALDDFGTGFSSLSYLTKLTIDTIKIDASFIYGTPNNVKDCQLVKTIINMANGLGLNVLAEGVENLAQQAFLTNNHCKHHQGYLYGKPVDADSLIKQIQELHSHSELLSIKASQ
ncbi:putative bifunctional diguanylate cyclase/phosphodiesterase [Colwellia sp. MEBiC06753]